MRAFHGDAAARSAALAAALAARSAPVEVASTGLKSGSEDEAECSGGCDARGGNGENVGGAGVVVDGNTNMGPRKVVWYAFKFSKSG